jgi:hypothetical protein
MEEIPLIWGAAGAAVPEMVMRIADGKLRLQGGFFS